MGHALQTVAGTAVAAGAGVQTIVPAAGDTFNVASFNLASRASLGQVSAAGAVADFVRIRSPRLHDANQGLRIYTGTTKFRSLLPWELYEPVYPADTPVVEVDATGAGNVGILITYEYDDLPGAAPLLADWPSIAGRIVHTMGCEVDVTSGAVGTWGASTALNANFDNFEAGATYALLGYTVNAGCLGLGIVGKDTSSLRIGFPGDPDPVYSRYYFIDASQRSGVPYIPLIQANNKSSTILQNIDTAAATAVKCTLILAQLSG